MNKRASLLHLTFNIGMLIPRLVLMVFATLSFVMLIRYFLILNIDVSEAQSQILINRFVYSPNCFSYTNPEFNRAYPGVVDLQRFDQKVLAECVYYGERNDYAAAKLVLRFFDTDEEVTLFYNQEGYDVWLPRVNMKGPGGAELFGDEKYVLVKDGENFRRAILDVEVLIPNY